MKSTLLAVLFLAPLFLFAQQPVHQCGSYDIIKQWETQYPGTKQALDQVIKEAQQHSKTHDKRDGSRSSDTIYRIPVVVHIVYTSAIDNIHDSLVYNQIEVLNQAFRRDNGDTVNTRAEFKPFAGDAGIEFYLADLDPDGNPTTGITRTLGNPPPFLGFSTQDEVKKNSTGGKDAWPTDRYLNIWVCNLFNGFGLLGYAYPPVGNLPNWPSGVTPADTSLQGVVIFHEVFGRNNPLALNSQFFSTAWQGKTTVHEVAHYLGLRHIWGDGPCNEDDFVADTPPAADNSQQICNFNLNECPASCPFLPDYPNMIENYMDYSADSCMNMFTYGQIEIMRGILATYRSRLPQITLGTIKPSAVSSVSQNTFIATNTDSVVVTIDFTRWQNGVTIYPYNYATGDSLNSSVNGDFTAVACQQIVLYPGDYIINASGDTLRFTVGDTISTYDDGTLEINEYRETVGVNTLSNETFSLYPNPTTGNVFVRLAANTNARTVTIVNLLGEVVLNKSVNTTGNIALDVNHLAPGVYLVQVQGSEGIATQRLVIQ